MLKLTFAPDNSDTFELTLATYGYINCWQKYGEQIIDKLEELTGLKFQQSEINAVIVQGVINNSGMTGKPMRLGAGYNTEDEKLAVLSHELSHRLLGGNKVWVDADDKDAKYLEHRRIYLFLYDVWYDLKGEEFAQTSMKRELEDANFYEKAWKWALDMDRKQRQEEFKKIITNKLGTQNQIR